MASNTPKSKKTTISTASEKKEPKAKSAPKPPASIAEKPVKAIKPVAKKPATPTSITAELIAQRAYYIAEERQRIGAAGDSTQDWLNAEKQLKTELKPKKAVAKKAK